MANAARAARSYQPPELRSMRWALDMCFYGLLEVLNGLDLVAYFPCVLLSRATAMRQRRVRNLR